ncbi:hypothetical protein OIU77_026210 [Salix suchowensis]|uniref:Uncharacterized protein n=1 Tax=Salix suchowensis TaxID=1278906 RepID=A0ABQ9C1Y6_9ROSI|nr:hypothetical protein OIU77_026210 [Salix suchowensis]
MRRAPEIVHITGRNRTETVVIVVAPPVKRHYYGSDFFPSLKNVLWSEEKRKRDLAAKTPAFPEEGARVYRNKSV